MTHRVRGLAGRLARQEDGAIGVLVVLCMVVLLGFLSFASDAGMLYVHRTQLQKAADAAALAGARDIGFNGNSVGDALSYARLNGVDPTKSGTSLVTNAGATVFASGDAWTVSVQRTVPLVFAPLLGINSSSVYSTATAISSPAQGVPSDGLLPYAVWGGNIPPGLSAGTTVDYRDNHYGDDNVLPDTTSNPNWTVGSNDFKGFLRLGSGTVHIGDLVSQGGNAIGQEPIGPSSPAGSGNTICDYVLTGKPAIFPVMSSATGDGIVTLTVNGFIALKLNPVRGCGGPQGVSIPFTGTVVNFTTWNAQPGGPPGNGYPAVRVLKIWQ